MVTPLKLAGLVEDRLGGFGAGPGNLYTGSCGGGNGSNGHGSGSGNCSGNGSGSIEPLQLHTLHGGFGSGGPGGGGRGHRRIPSSGFPSDGTQLGGSQLPSPRYDATSTPSLQGSVQGDVAADEEEDRDSLMSLLATGASLTTRDSFEETASRITHAVYLCGKGTFLSPHWVELDDFKAYAALQSTLHASAAVVVACLNTRLMRLDRWSSHWRAA